MALTVGEANAVNAVIHHLVGDRTYDGEPHSRENAIDALVLLTKSAYKVLHAGYTPQDSGPLSAREALTTRWPDTAPAVWLMAEDGDGDTAVPCHSEQEAKCLGVQLAIDAMIHGNEFTEEQARAMNYTWRNIAPNIQLLYIDGAGSLITVRCAEIHRSAR
jgi:hypothetical protein